MKPISNKKNISALLKLIFKPKLTGTVEMLQICYNSLVEVFKQLVTRMTKIGVEYIKLSSSMAKISWKFNRWCYQLIRSKSLVLASSKDKPKQSLNFFYCSKDSFDMIDHNIDWVMRSVQWNKLNIKLQYADIFKDCLHPQLF